MKRLSLVVLIVFVGIQFSFAQNKGLENDSLYKKISEKTQSHRSFRFGMKAAAMFCWMKPDLANDNIATYKVEGGGGRLGAAWGPIAEFQLNETFLISTGVDVNYTSFKLEGIFNSNGSLVEWSRKYKARMFEIPVMLKFRTKEIGYLRYFGLFGVGLSGLYKSSAESSSSTNVVALNNEYGKYIKEFRGSVLVGAGVEYSLSGNTALVGSLVFNNGLFDVLKDQKDSANPGDPFSNIEFKAITNYMQLNVGILF
jgi:hypothetical protein